MYKQTLQHLRKNITRNINMINFMQDYPIDSIERAGDSVLIRGTSDHPWVYISSSNKEELQLLTSRLHDDDKYFAVVDDWMLPHLTHGKDLEWQLTSLQLVLSEHVKLPPLKYEAGSICFEYADYIYSLLDYKEVTNPSYIADRIKRGVSAGIYDRGKLVAWAATHDDGAIGFLHVREEYRGKGYGFAVLNAMCHRLRSKDLIPFEQIDTDNVESLHLAKKFGFSGNRLVHWFKLA